MGGKRVENMQPGMNRPPLTASGKDLVYIEQDFVTLYIYCAI